jgi:hypothetical protein
MNRIKEADFVGIEINRDDQFGFVIKLNVYEFFGCSSTDNAADSKAYVDKVAPVIFKDWDTALILGEADPDLKNYADTNKDVFEKGIQSFKDAVGSMKTYKGATLLDKPTEGPDKTVTAAYSVEANFEKGTSKIMLTTTLRDGKWKMGIFNLDPQAELQRMMRAMTPNP